MKIKKRKTLICEAELHQGGERRMGLKLRKWHRQLLNV